MKLMIVILSDRDCEPVLEALIREEFRVTRIASTGGFLRRGNSTMFLGLDEDKVDQALEIIRETACDQMLAAQRRATVFVLDVARYEQL
ncbi:MAG: cyclic-di-AMP receptor [Anaerolineales bacterium]|jgi:uncharacterized protein YaaQ